MLGAGAVVLVASAGGCASSRFGAPEPASRQAGDVLDLWRVLFVTALAIGILVVGLILWSVVRYRLPSRSGQEAGEPPQFRANLALEVFYTAVPLVIVAVLFGLTVRAQNPGLLTSPQS